MARVTVEDCLLHVESHFDLVLKSAKRARSIAQQNSLPLVPEEGDKPTVIALREIAANISEKDQMKQYDYTVPDFNKDAS